MEDPMNQNEMINVSFRTPSGGLKKFKLELGSKLRSVLATLPDFGGQRYHIQLESPQGAVTLTTQQVEGTILEDGDVFSLIPANSGGAR